MRVYELARELGYSSKEFLEIVQQLGVDVKSNLSVIDDDTAGIILSELKGEIVADSAFISDDIEPLPAPSTITEPEPEPLPEPIEEPELPAPAVSIPDTGEAGVVAPPPEDAAKPSKKKLKGKKPEKEKKEKREEREDKQPEKKLEKKKKHVPTRKEAAQIQKQAVPEKPELIQIGDSITVAQLASKMNIPAAEVIKSGLKIGIMANINQLLDLETAEKLAETFGVLVDKSTEEDKKIDYDWGYESKQEDMKTRAPIVTIMGHVDHGKTTLLDALRSSKIVDTEAGNITQHIGAYNVSIPGKGSVVFLDTPGHEAFTQMRSRGAQVTDVVVLVVAADDGVKPQTVEAIHHAQAAEVPIIVAVNKIDLPGADPDRVMQELTQYELVPEKWGGKTIFVEISAKQDIGIDELLEMLLLEAELLEMKADPKAPAKGVVLEAELDRGKGPVAKVLILDGTLKVGDNFVCGNHYGKVRALVDEYGKRHMKVGPATPIEIQGLNSVPDAGDPFHHVPNERTAREISATKQDEAKEAMLAPTRAARISLGQLRNRIDSGDIKQLSIVLKGDVQGSVEAITESFEKLSGEEVTVKVIHGGVGAVSESDVLLAVASDAIIMGFNVRPDSNAEKLAASEGVEIQTYRIIYDAINDVEAAIKGMLTPKKEEVVIGKAEIREVFRVTKVGNIAGCYVLDGKVNRKAGVRVIRDGVITYEGVLSSLKRFKDDAREVASGYECGIGIEKFNDVKVGDILEFFSEQEIVE